MKYVFQPERNTGTPDDTHFVFCTPEQAETWAVYADAGSGGSIDGPELIGDLPVTEFNKLLARAAAGPSRRRRARTDQTVRVAMALREMVEAVEEVRRGNIGVEGRRVGRALDYARSKLHEVEPETD